MSLLQSMENDPLFRSHMKMMRQMDNMFNSILTNPFGMHTSLMGAHDRSDSRVLTHHGLNNPLLHSNPLAPFNFGGSLMPFMMPNLHNMLDTSFGNLNNLGGYGDGHSYSSSTVVSMTSGSDGKPQVYKATSSTRTAPGGIKETQRTVTDSVSGTKKMAIGHHIGERAHIIEKEQNMHTGDREERQDFINLDEEEAEDFNKEWETKARCRSEIPRITAASSRNRYSYGGHSSVPAITAGSSSRRQRERHSSLVTPRRSIRPPTSTSVTPASALAANRTPYSPPGASVVPRRSKNIKTVSGSPPPADM